MQLIIDKRYLQGASAHELRSLCAEHTVLFIETLLYELLTTEEEAVRKACFVKFPETNDNVVLTSETRRELSRVSAAISLPLSSRLPGV